MPHIVRKADFLGEKPREIGLSTTKKNGLITFFLLIPGSACSSERESRLVMQQIGRNKKGRLEVACFLAEGYFDLLNVVSPDRL